jgi:hypothetical protein
VKKGHDTRTGPVVNDIYLTTISTEQVMFGMAIEGPFNFRVSLTANTKEFLLQSKYGLV